MATDKPGKYDDIFDLPHHHSAKHPHMTPMERAAQFSPFAALTGRLVDPRLDLTEDEENSLDRTLQELQDRVSEKPTMHMLYLSRTSASRAADLGVPFYGSVSHRFAPCPVEKQRPANAFTSADLCFFVFLTCVVLRAVLVRNPLYWKQHQRPFWQ